MTSTIPASLPLDNNTFKPGSRQSWSGLSGSSLGLVIAGLADQHSGFTVVITENSHQAERLHAELEFFCRLEDGASIEDFPDWEILPYDTFSPHQDIISRRLETLGKLGNLSRGILIVPISTLLHRLMPHSYIAANSLQLQAGQKFNLQDMSLNLEKAGYVRVDSVFEHGEYAVRGAIMDLYPMGSTLPLRIELFDDEIESLRQFDPETQLSSNQVEAVNLLPGKEYPLNEQGIAQFRRKFREHFDVDLRHCPLYEDVSNAIASPGIEYYLPLFFEEQSTLFDYLPDNVLLCTTGDISTAAEQVWRDVRTRYEERRYDLQRPVLPPHELFMRVDELFSRMSAFPQINMQVGQSSGKSHFELTTGEFPALDVDQKLAEPLQRIHDYLHDHSGKPILICTDSPGRRETLLELLKTVQISPVVFDGWHDFLRAGPVLGITVAPIDMGMWLDKPEIIVITENQLFVHHVGQARRRGKVSDDTDFIVKSLTELHEGAPVVHIDHGIGRYRGLQCFDVEGQQVEFLVLEYADKARLYVPVSSLHLITRYSGADADSAPLHKLGNDQWEKAKKKAAEKIVDVAAELLDVYARREAQKGLSFKIPRSEYQMFANSFPFEETEDQEQAISSVVKDMASEQAMDRLVCGDVGFGKTEVALRAAFIAVMNNTQVAVLVPTTLLAQQHFENFKDRFADWPVNVALMSRFVDSAQQKKNLEQLKAGNIDIVIGTHKLLQSDIGYKKLGLLIIDEEHRFGVRQKEKLKAMRANVDILTLTATPIPRTLNMAMSGMRDLSIIASPPARRLSIKTFVRQPDNALIKEAILRELLRGGQVFYLHNEVKTIDNTAEEIRELVPEARVCVGHGQMREKELERVMSDFYHKRYNILVCSTIIETGIDIPSANTIIIDRADKFGLAQLHQLRGRVGRSHHQAYAYLLAPPMRALKGDAQKRLEAISSADTLGAGFTLASHDLEIRGAGELLGDEQSGQIQTIGFTLYSEMLDQTVKLMKQGKQPDLGSTFKQETDINLRVPALIPGYYLPDVHTRLMLYKRISNAATEPELRQLKVEMIDRFGLLPEPVKLLFDVTVLKLKALNLGIGKIEGNVKGGRLKFKSDTSVDPISIVRLVQDKPDVFVLDGASVLRFNHTCEDSAQRIEFVNQILQSLMVKMPQQCTA